MSIGVNENYRYWLEWNNHNINYKTHITSFSIGFHSFNKKYDTFNVGWCEQAMWTFNHFAELERNVLSLETMTTWYCTLSSIGKQPTFKDVTYCSAYSLSLWKYCLFKVYIYQNSKIPFRLFIWPSSSWLGFGCQHSLKL